MPMRSLTADRILCCNPNSVQPLGFRSEILKECHVMVAVKLSSGGNWYQADKRMLRLKIRGASDSTARHIPRSLA